MTVSAWPNKFPVHFLPCDQFTPTRAACGARGSPDMVDFTIFTTNTSCPACRAMPVFRSAERLEVAHNDFETRARQLRDAILNILGWRRA
jgi:hypothetical protein